jgi:hypothetical protein
VAFEEMSKIDIDPTKIFSAQNLGQVLAFAEGTIGGEQMTEEQSFKQAQAVIANLHRVPMDEPGTCGDERGVVGTLGGMRLSNPRRSVFAGPAVFGYGMGELVGWFEGADSSPIIDRFSRSTRLLEAHGIVAGGHVATNTLDANFKNGTGCGANDGLETWMDFIIAHPDAVNETSRLTLGSDFDSGAMDELLRRATLGRARVRGWDPNYLLDYLAERAQNAIDVRKVTKEGVSGHKGRSVALMTDPEWALDFEGLEAQTGEQTFLHNLGYGKQIADALATESKSDDMSLLLTHAQPAVLTGVSGILLNGKQDVYLISPR